MVWPLPPRVFVRVPTPSNHWGRGHPTIVEIKGSGDLVMGVAVTGSEVLSAPVVHTETALGQ